MLATWVAIKGRSEDGDGGMPLCLASRHYCNQRFTFTGLDEGHLSESDYILM